MELGGTALKTVGAAPESYYVRGQSITFPRAAANMGRGVTVCSIQASTIRQTMLSQKRTYYCIKENPSENEDEKRKMAPYSSGHDGEFFIRSFHSAYSHIPWK